jgi:SAM-dependent methyltransferase
VPDYLQPYQHALDLHGVEFDVTLWASPQTQSRRFQVFTQMVNLAGKRILDAGCSRGDFAAFLLQARIEYHSFVGIDGLAAVIEHARAQKLPRCEFLAGDFLANPSLLSHGRPDVICISGSLNTMNQEQALQTLEHAWHAAGSSLVFNFLSDRCGPEAPDQDTYSRRLDTMRLIDWALSKTPSVQFRQDYFAAGHDATVAMRKPLATSGRSRC